MNTQSEALVIKRILCVEDEPVLAKLYKELLEKEGYEVDVAYDGEEGLRMILTDKYDLITLDHVMPKMFGDEVLEKLRSTKLKGMIGMLTNLSDDEHILQALECGINFYMVTSCYYPETFVQEVNHYINSDWSFVGPDHPEGCKAFSEQLREHFTQSINRTPVDKEKRIGGMVSRGRC